jgi:nucleotide-binding universal stress UspA family protein
MYKNILVPLDGSDLAECVLPHVEAITSGCEVKNVTFVHVAEPIGLAQPQSEELQEAQASYMSATQDYLTGVAGRFSYGGANVRLEVIDGPAVESIAGFARENDVDLIVMATHGRSGISRWVWGSVADRVLRSSGAPVLLVRAPGCIPGI